VQFIRDPDGTIVELELFGSEPPLDLSSLELVERTLRGGAIQTSRTASPPPGAERTEVASAA
jgi:hypothetical protein